MRVYLKFCSQIHEGTGMAVLCSNNGGEGLGPRFPTRDAPIGARCQRMPVGVGLAQHFELRRFSLKYISTSLYGEGDDLRFAV